MTAKEINIVKVWNEYQLNKSPVARNQLITHYIGLVKYVLQNMSLPTNSILTDEDFMNIGILGLNEAIERFEISRGVKFESYAVPRIKGIIQDELRRLDWLSRTARKKASDFIQAGDSLRSEVGREVSSEEIRNKLNVSPEEYHSYLVAAAAAKASLTLNEYTQAQSEEDDYDILEEIPDTSQENTLSIMLNEERMNFLTVYLKNLNEKKRLVMTLYYYENMTFKEIGVLLNISESRVCQIHTQIIADLRIKINEFDNA